MENNQFYETPEFLQAKKKFDELGPLAVTAEDHRAISSTPPEILELNLGKTEVELMTDEEILGKLKKWQQDIQEFSQEKYQSNSFVTSILSNRKHDLKVSIVYLRSIGRLPKEFEDFDAKSLE